MKNKVLLIDDSITIHRVIDLSIDLEKYEIVKVFSQEAASAKLKELNFDFILLDNKLENTVISSYIKEIKLLQPASRVILLVGAFDKFDPEDSSKAGADDYLVKPFDSQSLNMKLTLSPASPAKQSVPQAGASDMSASFVNNIPKADAAREQQAQKPTPPSPVNKTVVFHDPSEDPVKTEPNEKPFFYSPSNPFGEEPEKEENPNAFDPASQFEELGAGNDEEEQASSSQGFSQESTFGIPVYDAFDVADAGKEQLGSATAEEKTFVYDEEEAAAPAKIEIQNDLENTAAGDTFTSEKHFQEMEISEAAGGETAIMEQNLSETDSPVFEFANKGSSGGPHQENNFGPKNPINLEETLPAESENAPFEENILSVGGFDNKKEEEEKSSPVSFGSAGESPQEEEFYKLDEDAIFNKPVSGIFEEEILSLDSPEKDGNEKPISQKFEEEILSIDDPGDGSESQTSPDSGEPNFFDPASLEEISGGAGPSKPIAQKFEEEILSLSDPQEKDKTPEEGSKNIHETFEEEILSIGTSEEKEKAEENTDYLFEHLGEEKTDPDNPIETNPFAEGAQIASKNPFSETAAMENTPFPDQNLETAATSSEDAFYENDDLFKNETLTKEFADEIFPRGEDIGADTGKGTLSGEDTFSFQDEDFSQNTTDILDTAHFEETFQPGNHKISESDEKTNIVSEENIRINETENDLFSETSPFSIKSEETTFHQVHEATHQKSENTTTNDKKQNKGISASMDDTLDLDELLNMDLTENNKTGSANTLSAKNTAEEDPDFFKAKDADAYEKAYAEEKAEMPAHASAPDEKILEDAPFDLIKMDSVPASNENINIGDNIFSGITVTISKEEIMKMLGNAIDKHFLEKAVQEVLAQNMREIVRAVVPSIAEKFIKEEIEKLKEGEEDI